MFTFKDGIRGNRHLDAFIYECVDINVWRCGIVACGHCVFKQTLCQGVFFLIFLCGRASIALQRWLLRIAFHLLLSDIHFC